MLKQHMHASATCHRWQDRSIGWLHRPGSAEPGAGVHRGQHGSAILRELLLHVRSFVY